MESIDDILAASSFHFGGVYVWARVREVEDGQSCPSLVRTGRIACPPPLLVARDEKETTVVTSPENLGALDVVETNPDRWLLLSIDCASPFYCVGFIARISARLSAAGIDILVISTFSRDLFFVKEEEGGRAAAMLREMGLSESSPSHQTTR